MSRIFEFTSSIRAPRTILGAALLSLAAAAGAQDAARSGATYTNPLPLRLADGSLAESCADPSLLRDRTSTPAVWYMYCTMDPVSHKERDGKGWKFRMMPVYRSVDLVNWYFVRDSFDVRPAAIAGPTSGLWAPEPVYQNGSYYLYFTVTDVADAHSPEKGCEGDSGIGVATSASPSGPWTAAPELVVPPRRAGAGCNFHWTYDPDVVETAQGDRFLYYGSYGGGIYVQRLARDGLKVEGDPVRIAASDRYEGAEVVRHGDWWYLFASSTDCCRGPLTGYAMYVGRARTPEGPFLDRLGNDMAAARVGGTPLLQQNGNRWVGAGHNTVFQDPAGQWWTFYHAIDQNQGYFSVEDKLTRRPLLLDRIDWIDGWPVVNRDRGPSDTPQPRPAIRPGPVSAAAPIKPVSPPTTPLWRDSFAGAKLDPRWRWVREDAAGSWAPAQGGLRMATQGSDLHVDTNTAAVLTTALPAGDLRIEARLRLDAPLECCTLPVQAGLVVMRDDDNYLKLVELAHKGLRQVEFGKELAPVAKGYPRYGNTVVGTPGEWTWLRIDIRRGAAPGEEERYTAWSSQDGKHWVRGGTWNHRLGAGARLGLVAMGGAGHAATFGEVRVMRLGR